jgi:hypothetical protein
MDLLTLILVLALIGFVLWLITTYIPMPDPFKQVIVVLVIIVLVVWLARVLLGGTLALPRLR